MAAVRAWLLSLVCPCSFSACVSVPHSLAVLLLCPPFITGTSRCACAEQRCLDLRGPSARAGPVGQQTHFTGDGPDYCRRAS
jgi:hypothetical protein